MVNFYLKRPNPKNIELYICWLVSIDGSDYSNHERCCPWQESLSLILWIFHKEPLWYCHQLLLQDMCWEHLRLVYLVIFIFVRRRWQFVGCRVSLMSWTPSQPLSKPESSILIYCSILPAILYAIDQEYRSGPQLYKKRQAVISG